MEARSSTLKVFVITNSASLRRQLSDMFDSMPAIEQTGQANSLKNALANMAATAPDLILLHADPRKNGGLQLINDFCRHDLHCSIAILSKISEVNTIRKFLQTCADHSSDGERPKIYVIPEDQAQIRICIESMICNKSQAVSDHPPGPPDGSAKYLYEYVNYVSNKQPEGKLSGMTERRRKQTGRRQSEIERLEAADRFQAFIEQLPGMPYIASLDKDGRNVYISPRIEQLLGFTAAQWCKHPDLRITQLHAEDRPKVLQAIVNAIDTQTGFSIDYRIHRRDGTIRWFHDEANVIMNADGEALFLQGAMIDITGRKEAQTELEKSHHELQELITALDSLRLEEQKRLAHEMHDDFGQLLAAMKMDISTLRQCLPTSDSKIMQYLGNINELIDAMVTSVRRIAADLPPKILEDLGLFGALEMMMANFEKRHKIDCHLLLSDFEPELDTKVATSLYRLMQEMLNNVAKHAHATHVEAKVDCSDRHIRLCVTDNGQGIPKNRAAKTDSFGLIGMRERVIALGGEMEIDSAEGQGTAVRIVVPVDRTAPPRAQ